MWVKRQRLAQRVLLSAVPLCLALMGAAAWQASMDVLKEDKEIRRAGFTYYSSTVLGDAQECMKVIRLPLVAIRDGTVRLHTADSFRTMVADVGKKTGVARLSEEARKEIIQNMLRVFDDADIRFLGARTASLTFVVRPAPSRDVGDMLAELVLCKTGDKWLVVAEVTDSKPAPPMPDLPEVPER